jgi:transposase
MTDRLPGIDPVPIATARVARAALPKGALALRLRDVLDVPDAMLAMVGPSMADQPTAAPWRLALITMLQFSEGLTDHQATEAVRYRIDWKYGLSLDLTDPGLEPTALRRFRARCADGHAERVLLDALLTHWQTHGVFTARRQQRLDATQLLTAVQTLNRATGQG